MINYRDLVRAREVKASRFGGTDAGRIIEILGKVVADLGDAMRFDERRWTLVELNQAGGIEGRFEEANGRVRCQILAHIADLELRLRFEACAMSGEKVEIVLPDGSLGWVSYEEPETFSLNIERASLAVLRLRDLRR